MNNIIPIFPDFNAKLSDFNFLRSNELLITNIWSTLQGEGPYSGLRCVFLRLSGCHWGAKGTTGAGCQFCFVGDSLVHMGDNSLKPIKDVMVGDQVVSYNELTNLFEIKTVTKKYISKTNKLMALKSSSTDRYGAMTYVTEEHPFLVKGRGWVAAKDLTTSDILLHFGNSEQKKMFNPMKNRVIADKVGMTLKTNYAGVPFTEKSYKKEIREKVSEFIKNGHKVYSVNLISNEDKSWKRKFGEIDELDVYNLEVDGNHTYIVHGKIVHNCDTDFRFEHGTAMSFTEIEQQIQSIHPGSVSIYPNHFSSDRLVIVTGGEPFLQHNIAKLIYTMEKNGYKFQIETSGGAGIPDNLSKIACVVVSPKIPTKAGDSRTANYKPLNKKVYDRANSLKILVSADPDSPYHKLPFYTEAFYNTGRDVYLSPINVYKDRPKDTGIWDTSVYDHSACAANHAYAADLCIRHGYRLSLQTHLYCRIP